MTTKFQVVYWRDIPAQVKVRSGGTRLSRSLGARFQQAIDQAAMIAGKAGSDEYLGEWRTGAWQDREGSADETAEAICAELEVEFPMDRLRKLAESGGLEG